MALPKHRVVLLDDDRIQHLLLKKRIGLISSDVELVAFERCLDALQYLTDHPADLVFSDLNLGEMQGWDFVDELEKIGFGGKLFFLTGSILSEDRDRANDDPRISGFFEKPISEGDLFQVLSR